MPQVQPLLPSFNSGELTPRLSARLDFVKYPAGLEICENLIPISEGGIFRRPSTRFVAELANSEVKGRLSRFQFNVEQAYILELGAEIMRFYRHQGQIVAPATDAVVTNGTFAANITGWDDLSLTGGSIAFDATNEMLELTPGGVIATAEQDITTTDTGVEHVLRFRIYGQPGDEIEFQVGASSGAADIFGPVKRSAGYHTIAFIPTASPFYIQFSTVNVNKVVRIDDISLLSDTPVEITTPWFESYLYQVEGPQSADERYMFHAFRPPYKLQRYGHTSWSLVQIAWQDGPYLDINTTSTTMTPNATSGVAATVTASSTTGINDDRGFLSTDINRLIRINNGSAWGWGIITAVGSTTSVTVHIKKAFAATSGDTEWRLGAWSDTTGWPEHGTFFEQRLYVACTAEQPQTLWASQTADFENFKPDDDAGTVEEDDALDYTLSADDVNKIHWLSAGEDVLAIGTTGGQWKPTASGVVLTPVDITIRRQTTHAAADIAPTRVGNSVLFVQRALRKLRKFVFDFESDSYQAPDMTRLAQHITLGGVVEMAYAEEPESLVWVVRQDGVLLSMTFRPDEDVVGWGRHIIGGSFGAGDAVVESVSVIPGANGLGQVQDSTSRDEVWVIVKRTINDTTKRYVEVFERMFETGDDQEDAYYVDSCITYDGTAATTITGLDHLEGETVKVWADGAVFPDTVVASGQITLDTAASVAQIGLGYRHRMKPLRITANTPYGTPVGKFARIHAISFVLLNSHFLRFGPNINELTDDDFRIVSNPIDAGVPLFSGPFRLEFPGSWERDARIVIEGDAPAPFGLLAMAPEITINPIA